MPPQRIAEKLFNEPWAIQKEWLAKIISIADRESDLEALEAKLGKPLEYAYEATVRGSTAIIPIDGPIFPKAGIFGRMSGAVSLEMIAQDFQEAIENSDISNIVLKANSPGGSITFVDEMASLVRNSPKKVYAHISGIGASALYWVISGAAEISASPASSAGSLGVVSVYRKEGDSKDTLEFVSSVSPRKRLDPETEEGAAAAMETVNKIAEVFIADVAQGRGTSPEDVIQNFGQGGMLIAQDALAAGMIDKVCTFEELMASLSEQETTSYGENPMNVDELKAEHRKVYDAVLATGAAEANEKSTADKETLESANATLQTENTQLKADAEKAADNNKENAARIQKLEKKDAIRQSTQTANKASSLAGGLVAASDIPASLHSKVIACVDHEDFMVEGVLDEKAFASAVKTEVADWESGLTKDAPLAGFGSSGKEAAEDGNEEKTNQAVDSLLSHLNLGD